MSRAPKKLALESVSILDACGDQRLFGPWFQGDSWKAWFAFLAALFGRPMSEEQAALLRKFTGRQTLPTKPFREGWVCVGRRGGKSIVAALVAVYLAFFRDYAPYLAPGEVATIMVVAADRKQARTIMRYVKGFIAGVPMFSRTVTNETRESLELSNRVVLEIHTSSYRSVRGYTCAACINDETNFWPTDLCAEPAKETIAAQRPSLTTIPGSVLLSISSAYAQQGPMYETVTKHHGKDDSPLLVWWADSLAMNPKLDRKVIADAYEADPIAAAAEYGSKFRSDVAAFVSREAVEACVVRGRRELPPRQELRHVAFVDPSGGSADSMTLAIAHSVVDGSTGARRGVLDCLRERRPPFSPDSVVQEFVELLKPYGLSEVWGDRYAGEWARERFRKHGVEYRISEKAKGELYLELLPLLNSGRAELLDETRLRAQLCGLERRTSRSGKDSVDHAPGSHDDLANAAAGALVLAASGKTGNGVVMLHTGGRTYDFNKNADGAARELRLAKTWVPAGHSFGRC